MTQESHPSENLAKARELVRFLFHNEAVKRSGGALKTLQRIDTLIDEVNSCSRCELFAKLKHCPGQEHCYSTVKGVS